QTNALRGLRRAGGLVAPNGAAPRRGRAPRLRQVTSQPLFLKVVDKVVRVRANKVIDQVRRHGENCKNVYHGPDSLGEKRDRHVAQPDSEKSDPSQLRIPG